MDLEELKASVEGIANKLTSMDKSEEIKAMREKFEAMQDEVRRLKQRAPESSENNVPLTIGEAFVKSDAYKANLEGRRAKFEFTKATAVLGNNGTTNRVSTIGTTVGGELISLVDAINPIPTADTSIEFMQEKAWTNNAATVLEAAEKPESAIEVELVQRQIQVIAHVIPVTRQLIDDAPALAAFINKRMEDGLKKTTENEVLNGNGTSGHLSGLLNVGNYTAHGLIQATGETNLDLIRKCAQAIRKSEFSPNAVILNPSDYDAIMSIKATDGTYLMVNPAANNAPTLWGLRVIQSSKIATGQFVVGDMSQLDLYERQGITIEAFEQDGDNVRKNKVTIRAERRCALAVYSPLAFVGGSLW